MKCGFVPWEAYIVACVHMRVSKCVRAHVHLCVCVCARAFMCVCACVCMCVYGVSECVCVCVCVCVRERDVHVCVPRQALELSIELYYQQSAGVPQHLTKTNTHLTPPRDSTVMTYIIHYTASLVMYHLGF